MAKLVWDLTGTRFYENGVSKGVLYLKDETGVFNNGVAWNGLLNVNEAPSGAEATPLWADNIKYAVGVTAEEFACTIEAYTYPDEFAACDGSAELVKGVYIGQQARETFGFCYRNEIHSDDKTNLGYKITCVYNCLAAPSAKDHASINESVEGMTMSWEVSTTPVPVTNHKPTATVVIDSRKVDASKLVALEAVLYGDGTTPARLPLPDEIKELLAA